MSRYLKAAFTFALLSSWTIRAVAQSTPLPDASAPPVVAPSAPSSPPPAPVDAVPTRAQQLRRLAEQVAAQQSRLDEQQETIHRLEAQMKQAPPASPSTVVAEPPIEGPPPKAASNGVEGRETVDDPRERLLVYGYIQGQFQTDASSQDAIGQDGRPLNQDRFLVPRARIVAEREWAYAAGLIELDGNTLNGPSFGLQRAEATILHRGSNPAGMPPLLSVTIGQFRVPFGDENLQSPSVRYFMERSLASRAMFPSEIDLGLRIAGAIDWFRYSVAATNGQPLGTKDFSLQDPDAAKDIVGRLGVETKVAEAASVTAGVSSLIGRGFHEESAAVKPQIEWVDRNGDGIFQQNEVTGIDAIATRPSTTFRRFALALDAGATIRSPIGETQLGGAFYVGNNMDRGFYLSDPVFLGRDTRHVGYMLSVIQELGDWAVVGFRTDYYNPDSDSSDFQNAKPVQPNDVAIRTFSPLAGLRYKQRARLLFQYDFVRDKLGRDAAGIPTDLSNDRMTVRLQVSL